MLRINLEIYDGKRMRQVGELHVVNKGPHVATDMIHFYEVRGWYKRLRPRRTVHLYCECEHDREHDVMALAKIALENAMEVDRENAPPDHEELYL